MSTLTVNHVLYFCLEQDKGAYALAEALKANGEAAVTTLNLSSNYITKYGQVSIMTRCIALV